MPGKLSTTMLTRRRAIQTGVVAAAAALTGPVALSAQEGAEFTFIVAGLDHREGFDEHNSDVLMVSRVNTGTGSVNSVSIPRDLYVEIPGVGPDKITRAFHHGYYGSGESWDAGAATLTDTIAQHFGLDIDGVVTTDFTGFVQIIDELGGVKVDNPYEVIGFGESPSFPAGTQTLDGDAALVFVRTRKQDSDDGRVMRQQLVLRAILDQLQQPETIVKVPALVDILRDAVETNIPLGVQARLVAAVPRIDPAQVAFTNVADQLWGGTLDNGMWVYQADWSTLPGYVQALLAGNA